MFSPEQAEQVAAYGTALAQAHAANAGTVVLLHPPLTLAGVLAGM